MSVLQKRWGNDKIRTSLSTHLEGPEECWLTSAELQCSRQLCHSWQQPQLTMDSVRCVHAIGNSASLTAGYRRLSYLTSPATPPSVAGFRLNHAYLSSTLHCHESAPPHQRTTKGLRPSPIRGVMAPQWEAPSAEDLTPSVSLPATKLCFLLVCDGLNSMEQRAYLKLQERGHEVLVHIWRDGETMIADVQHIQPDVILCPFLHETHPLWHQGSMSRHPSWNWRRSECVVHWLLQ